MKLFNFSNCLSRGHPASGARMMMKNETGMIRRAVQMFAGCCNTAVEEVELID
jgi:hypothetical protein